MHTNMLIDLNNYAAITRYAKIPNAKSKRQKDRFVPEMIFYYMLEGVLNMGKELKADSVFVARDSKNTWRKQQYPEYKAGSTTKEDLYYEEMLAGADMFADFIENYTAGAVLKVDNTEADDIIAVWCQQSKGVNNIILSSDKDMAQLVDEHTSVYSPAQKKFRESEDPQYDLFVKCIRGDKNDNIPSAYPRVRETNLKKAWDDEYEMFQLMETQTKDRGKVGDNYEFNESLMNMNKIPQYVSDRIYQTILTVPVSGKFSEIKAMKRLGEIGLQDKHLKVFDHKSKCLKKHCVFVNK